jgi:hypothetical protein
VLPGDAGPLFRAAPYARDEAHNRRTRSQRRQVRADDAARTLVDEVGEQTDDPERDHELNRRETVAHQVKAPFRRRAVSERSHQPSLAAVREAGASTPELHLV